MIRRNCILRFWGCPLAVALALLPLSMPAAWADQASSQRVDFKADVYPLLKSRCFACHQGANAKAGLRLDVRAEILGETNGKPLVRVGGGKNSRLIQIVSGAVRGKVMPPRGSRLTPAEVALLREWIDQGLAWDDALLPPANKSDHWAFRPVKRPKVPSVKKADWVRTPVDAFVAARQEARGVTPAPEASRQTLVRRLTFDLTGLPPTLQEVDAVVNDPSPDWYEKLVDRLLASPRHGERWGRHWLDLARYADSEGYESDHPRPYAWRYRDYVVNSFNRDKPYDRFLREQLAGDEITPYSDENLIATGFLASARLSSNEEDKGRQVNDVLVDIVNATGGALLGLTFNCAQCHNHKFDPITARDYYAFQGFFVKGMPNNLALKDPVQMAAYEKAKPPEFEPAHRLRLRLYEAAQKRLVAQVRKQLSAEQRRAVDTPAAERTPEQERLAREAGLKFQFTPGQIEDALCSEDRPLYSELKKKLAAMEKEMQDRPQTWGFYSPATSPTRVEVLPMKGFYPPPYRPEELARARPHLLISGEVHRRGKEVPVGWPAVFGPTSATQVTEKPRTALAGWLCSPRNPLTARVWVNRIWQYHFGQGTVATPSDFGTRGARPTHPELLDWLADELIRSGWSTKHIHRLLVGSNTYRQAARGDAANARLDPDNLLWWHWPVRRLEVEAIRDAMLAVSGELDLRPCGSADPEATSRRRTLYLVQRRSRPPGVQKLFDGPTGATESCPKRNVSTVPLQALFLLNNEFALARAKTMAARVRGKVGEDRGCQAETAFRLALCRPPDNAEKQAMEKFFAGHRVQPGAKEPLALVHFCQALMNLNEFLYLE